jgi:cytoskeletal protein CcmA (bactofilin family)
MAISRFGQGKSEDTRPAPTPAASSGAGGGAAGNLTAFIDQGSNFEGKLSFKDTVRIDGGFKGEITSENTLIVGESGEVEATIASKTVVVSGSVMGNISATEQVVLHKSARLDGDIETPSIVIEQGALFNGRLAMGKSGSNSLKSIPGGGKPNESGNQAAGGQSKGKL